MAKKTIIDHEIEYKDLKPKLERLEVGIVTQLNELLKTNKISLGFPIQSRIKNLDSIKNKIEGKRFTVKRDLTELQDLVGVRIILLFSRDVKSVCDIIQKYFKVVKSYNTSEKLKDNEFGYSSEHIIVKLPDEWLKIPSYDGLDIANVEIQVRTLSQHIWAEASQTLQYKQEDNVPKPIKRTISRVSALLETIDLELDRVLSERESYASEPLSSYDNNQILNVDLLEKVLGEMLPSENKFEGKEEYSYILKNLNKSNITTIGLLEKFIDNNIEAVLREEVFHIKDYNSEKSFYKDIFDEEHILRFEKGIFFSHSDIIERMLFNALYSNE